MGLIIKDVRCDWVWLNETNQHGGWSMCLMLPNNHPQLARLKEEIEKAKEAGIAKGLFTAANTKSANFKQGLHDGTAAHEADERPAHYKGHWFANANQKSAQPGIVGPDRQPLLDGSCLYSGAYYHVDIGIYPYNNKSKGIGIGLNNVMWVRDGDRLDGRQNAEAAFEGLEVTEDGGDLQ